jgi:hypothetical protein
MINWKSTHSLKVSQTSKAKLRLSSFKLISATGMNLKALRKVMMIKSRGWRLSESMTKTKIKILSQYSRNSRRNRLRRKRERRRTKRIWSEFRTN